MRKAGELIAEMLSQVESTKKQRKVVGSGEYGVVYESNTPGYVIKEAHDVDEDLTREADLQSIAADMGIAPRVSSVTTSFFYPDSLEMEDIRHNFEPVKGEGDMFGHPGVGSPVDPIVNIRTAQQLGQLALKGIRLEDRSAANIVKNKMTGRPMQLDFGIAGHMSPDQQAAHLANVTAEGFEAAGIGELGSILRATVMDYLEGGKVAEAMDVAKQGFSRLQKIK